MNKNSSKNSNEIALITENQIKKMNVKSGQAYCFVQCSICDKRFACTYISNSWNVSNFIKHANTCKLDCMTITKNSKELKRRKELGKEFQVAKPNVLRELSAVLK